MKKKFVTISSLLLACIMSLSLTGCGGKGLSSDGKKHNDDPQTLEISVLKAGYGIDWLESMKNEYMQLHKNVDIYYSEGKSEKLVGELKDPSTTVDLYIVGGNFNNFVDKGNKMTPGYNCVMEPLDDVYSASINYGEEVVEGDTIADNMIGHYKDFCLYEDNHYYQMNWASGIDGIAYNKTIFDENGWRAPKTTNELIGLAEKIKAKYGKKKYAIVCANDTNYWEYMFEIWWAQYQTLQGHKDYFNGIIYDEFGDATRSNKVTEQQGRLESLTVIENLLAHDNGYLDPNFTGYNYGKAQLLFLNGNSLMITTGDWLQNEMLAVKDQLQNNYEISLMKAPVISSIIDRLDTINDEQTLLKVIEFVDGENAQKVGMQGVSDADIEQVKIARNITQTIGTNHSAGIPAFSNAKDLAKDFLKFMYSKRGQQIYIDKTGGSQLPMNYNLEEDTQRYNALTPFQKQRYAMMKNAHYVQSGTKLMRAGFSIKSPKTEDFEGLFGSTNSKDRMSAQEIFNNINEYWANEINWTKVLKDSGLN